MTWLALISQEAIRNRVQVLADEISRDEADAERLCLVGALKGAVIFLAVSSYG